MLDLKRLSILLLALMLIAPIGSVSAGENEDAADNSDVSDEDKNDQSDEHDDEADEKQDDKHRKDDDAREHNQKHRMNVDRDDDGIKVELKRDSGEEETKVEFKMNLDEAKFRLKYEEETETTELEQKLSVELKHLVEYRDADGDGAYTEGEEILSSWNLGDSHSLVDSSNGTVTWLEPSIEDITVNGIDGKKMSASASMGENSSALFTVDMMVFGEFNLLGNDSLAPTQVKIDFVIENYDYAANDTALALMLRTKTKQEQDYEHEDIDSDEEGLVASSITDSGTSVGLAFTWKGNATVDGVDTTVATTVFKSTTEDSDGEFEHKQDFALSYVRGDVIVHDPTLGVLYDVLDEKRSSSSSNDDGSLPGFSAILGVSALSLAAVRARKDE